MYQLRRLGIFLIFLSLGLVGVSSARGASSGGLGIFPAYHDPEVPLSSSWFLYNLVPGEVREDAVLINNTSDQTISAKLYAVDATTTKDGAFALRDEKEPRVDLGSWVKLEQDQVTLEPGASQTVPFTMAIPTDAAVGDHIGGIILENLRPEKAQAGGINIVTRVGVRIYETVPGDLVRKLALTDFSRQLKKNQIVFAVGLENQGNVHLDPRGTVEILDGFFGKKLTSFDIDLRTIFPGKPTLVSFTWEKAPPLGKFIARAKISFGDQPGETIQRELAFAYITQKALVILVLVFLALVAFWLVPKLLR